jgi:hypothetical protein
MPRFHRLLIAAAGALGLVVATSGCAPADEPMMGPGAQSAGRQCFLPRQVNGFTPLGNDRILVDAGPRRLFELEIVGTCREIDFSNRIGIRSRGGSWVCDGLDAELLVPRPSGLDRCAVTDVRRLSEEEVQAYRESRRRR